MGSKKQLLGFIEDSINDYLQTKTINTFYDAFTGSGRVAYYFANKYKVISSDKQHFSKIILDSYLKSEDIDLNIIDKYINELNNIEDSFFEKTDKWFTLNYATNFNNGISVGLDNKPKIWLTKNSRKIDIIRTKIDEIKEQQIKNILILSLILAVSKISNTLGHQNGYLKKWQKNTLNDLVLKNPIKDIDYTKIMKGSLHYTGEIFELLPKIEADLIYFDPPYGTNNKRMSNATRYSSFYHLWNTISTNDRPQIFGKANKPIDTKGWTPELEQNDKNIIIPLFEKLILLSKSKYVCFSYSNQALLTKEEFFDIFNKTNCKNIKCYERKHQVNKQTNTAKKEGIFIEKTEEEKKKELIEYFFIAEKYNGN